MSILETATPVVVVCTKDRASATAFYRFVLGLKFVREDSFAAIFSVGGITLRISTVAQFTPHEHTIFGFVVFDVPAAVTAMRDKGVVFNFYPSLKQDELGIWTAPEGTVRVAWFKDPDGNVLSVSNASA
ncbi:MAG: VOC family protein [Candidatus Acidiferrales bacterium]